MSEFQDWNRKYQGAAKALGRCLLAEDEARAARRLARAEWAAVPAGLGQDGFSEASFVRAGQYEVAKKAFDRADALFGAAARRSSDARKALAELLGDIGGVMPSDADCREAVRRGWDVRQ